VSCWGVEWKALMAVLSVLALACLIHVGMVPQAREAVAADAR